MHKYIVNLEKLDKLLKRSTATKWKIAHGTLTFLYSCVVILSKLLFYANHLIFPGSIVEEPQFQKNIFGEVIYNKAGFNQDIDLMLIIVESMLDLAILFASVWYITNIANSENITETSEQMGNDGNITLDSFNRNDLLGDPIELFKDYKLYKTQKFFSYTVQFILLAFVIVFSISIFNFGFLIVLYLMIVALLINRISMLDLINKLFTFSSLLFLGFLYTKNISCLKMKIVEYYLGLGNGDISVGYTMGYYVALFLAFCNSCRLNRYSNLECSSLEEVKSKVDTSLSPIEKKNALKNLYACNGLQICKSAFYTISHIFFKILLALWILFHVSVIFFLNFIVLVLGISQPRKVFSKIYMIISFAIGLFYFLFQFIFNMKGLFLYQYHIKVYKLLEVFGIYKYYKPHFDNTLHNIFLLDEKPELKFWPISTDILAVMLLFIFILSSFKRERKIEKSALSNAKDLNLEMSHTAKTNFAVEHTNLIHFAIEKSYLLCLIVVLYCSIVNFDAIHAIYFCFFILLISASPRKFLSRWEFLLQVNKLIIIIVLYFWNILAVNILNLETETNPSRENLFTYLGLGINKNSLFFVEYWEHILLFIFGYIHRYFVVKLSNNVESPNPTEEEKGTTSVNLDNLYTMPEWTRIIFLILTALVMIAMALIKHYSFQGLFFLIYFLMFIFAILFVFSSSFKQVFVKGIIKFLVFSSIAMIILKYCLNFSFIVAFLTEYFNLEDTSKYSLNSPFIRNEASLVTSMIEIGSSMGDNENPKLNTFSLQDFELDRANLKLKIFINAILIIISLILNSFPKYCEENELHETKLSPQCEQENEAKNSTEKEKEYQKTIISHCFTYVKVFLYQVIYLHSCKIMFILAVFICIYLESMIGVILFGVILLSLFLELNSGWRYSFIPLVFISMIVMSFIYICNLYAIKKWMTKDYEWFGIFNPKSESVLYDLFPYIVLMLLSFVTRIATTFSAYYNDFNLSEEMLSEIHTEDMKVGEKKEEWGRSDMSHSTITNISSVDFEKTEREIILSLSIFWKRCEFFWYLYGFYIVLIFIMLTSFIKVSVISLVLMIFVGVQSFGYYIRTEFITLKEEENKPVLARIQKWWVFFATMLAVFTFFLYINYMWFPPSWKISKPWEHFSFYCSNESKSIYSNNTNFKSISDYEYCVADWKAWLTIDNYGTSDIFYYFLCLFLLLLTQKFFTVDEIFHRKEFTESNELDFTITENRTSFSVTVTYFFFIYLKSFILFYIIVISIIYSYRYTNLIYGGFLFISFYLLYIDSTLVKQKNNLWKYVQYFNYFVLVGFVLFQTPFLLCPINVDGRSYIGLDECIEEENRVYKAYTLYEYPKNKVDAVYMMMAQTIGLLKLDFRLLVVGNLSLFMNYMAALVQQLIFDHPYQIFVDNYLKREKEINSKSRAFKIVQDIHLQVLNEERSIYNLNLVLNEKLSRLENRILRYSKLWQQTNFADSEESDNLVEKDEIEKIMKEEIQANIEAKFLYDKKNTGKAFYKFLCEECEKIRQERYKQFIEIPVTSNPPSQDANQSALVLKKRNTMKEGFVRKQTEEEFIKQLIDEVDDLLEKINSEQYIRDMRDLYREGNYGMGMASPIFEQMIQEDKGDLNKLRERSEIELLSKLFKPRAEEKNLCPQMYEQINTSIIIDISQRNLIPEERMTYFEYFKKQIMKSIDKNLLIDLTIPRQKIALHHLSLPELIIFSVYSNIEAVITIAFIINHCIEASIMSMVYPLTYFGYALIEYPFPTKTYWKLTIVYSLIVITVKLIYQIPFFCGYPFLSTFNVFGDHYCEYYTLSDQEIMEGFEYILGLRKYNGAYSYPKNSGLLYGIMWNIIILCLLLVMRSLQKSRGVWNFVNIEKDFKKVPSFEVERMNSANEEQNLCDDEYFPTFSSLFIKFLRRLVPELFFTNPVIYKPGYDYYPFSFASLLAILIYTLFFFGGMMGKNDPTITDVLEKQQFSKDLVYTVIILIFLIIFDRIIYKLRSIKNDYIIHKFKIKEEEIENEKNVTWEESKATTGGKHPEENIGDDDPSKMKKYHNDLVSSEAIDVYYSNMALIIKVIMHYTLLIIIHILIFFTIPFRTHIFFFNNKSLVVLYLLCCVYFYFSSMQLKYGFPLYTRGQFLTESTRLRNFVMFKIYRIVPFLYELRAILDWTITKTSLDLFQWMKIEDAYANLYEVKCEMEYRKSRKLGEDRRWIEKVSWGYCFFAFLMIILILPMILFSSFNPNLVENKVLSGKFSINLELRKTDSDESLYTLNLFDIVNLKISKIEELEQYEYLKSFLISNMDDVEERKIQKVKVVNYSQLDWIMTPPAMNAMLKNLEKKSNCYINISWEFRRELPVNNKNILGNRVIKLNQEQVVTLRNIIFALKNRQKPEIYQLDIKDAFPKIIRLTSKKYDFVKFDSKHKSPHKELTDIQIQLVKENERDIYWKLHQTGIKDLPNCIYIVYFKFIASFYNKNDELSFLLFNDDVVSGFFGFNSDGSIPFSIAGIYFSLVYTVGRFVRMFFDKISQRVIYEEMPEPDSLFELCEGVYIYRNQRDLEKENSLNDLLIRIYRSPETLIKITGAEVKYK